MNVADAVVCAFAVGGPVEGVRFGKERATTPTERFLFEHALAHELLYAPPGTRRPLWPLERQKMQDLLADWEALDSDVWPLALAALRRVGPAIQELRWEPGDVPFLTVCRFGSVFGAMQILRVQVHRLHHRGRIIRYPVTPEFEGAFIYGVDEAESWLREHTGVADLALDVSGSAPYLGKVHTGEGSPQERPALDGRSVGLAAAVGTVSAVLSLPVRRDVAFTGEVRARGEVAWVSGGDHKVRAAVNAGFATVVAPPGFARANPPVVEAATLDKALERAFEGNDQQRAVETFAKQAGPGLSLVEAERQRGEVLARTGRRILVSFVSSSDPVGIPRAGPAAGQEQPGAVLRCVEALRPQRVHLLLQPGDQVNEQRNLIPTQKRLQSLVPSPEVIPHRLDGGSPADYRDLARLIPPVVREILTQESDHSPPPGPNDVILLNTTSGSKQQGRILEEELVRQRLDTVLLEAPAGGVVGQVFPPSAYLEESGEERAL